MNKKKENNFESALKRLEEISDLLENEDTPLEDSIKLFEEGIELKEFCEDKLKSCLLYTSPSPRDREKSRMPSSA